MHRLHIIGYKNSVAGGESGLAFNAGKWWPFFKSEPALLFCVFWITAVWEQYAICIKGGISLAQRTRPGGLCKGEHSSKKKHLNANIFSI